MTALNQHSIILTGLPGSGKSRVLESLKRHYSCEIVSCDSSLQKSVIPGCCEWNDISSLPEKKPGQQQWCVIDIRSELTEPSEWVSDLLRLMVSRADGIVYSFAESAALNQQSWWNSWINKQAKEFGFDRPPIVRWFYQQFPEDFGGFDLVDIAEKPVVTGLQPNSFRFEVGQVMLDHLLMGLDNSMRTLGMKITRVRAVVDTFEFDNRIVLEGTPYRLDTYAANQHGQKNLYQLVANKIVLPEEEKLPCGVVEISGVDLQQEWLEQLIQACKI
jgi:hypothetical protein